MRQGLEQLVYYLSCNIQVSWLAFTTSDFVKRVINYLSSLERNLWVLNITNDLNVPVFVALSQRWNLEQEDIIYGFGCHFNPIVPIEKAVLKLLLGSR